MSQIGVFVLDTTTGKPAAGVPVRLQRARRAGDWADLADGVTDAEGCIPSLLPESEILPAGDYRLLYDTRRYFETQGVRSLYPRICIEVTIDRSERYVLPLLLSPHGYSTYRGS